MEHVPLQVVSKCIPLIPCYHATLLTPSDNVIAIVVGVVVPLMAAVLVVVAVIIVVMIQLYKRKKKNSVGIGTADAK